MSGDDHRDGAVDGGRRSFVAGVAAAGALAAVPLVTARARADDPVDVRTHGAGGDGQADDTDAIQAAIDDGESRGHPVFFPPGTYRTTRTLQVRSDVDLYGDDASYAVIRHDLAGKDDDHRRAHAACIRVQDERNERRRGAHSVSLRRLRLTTTEPRADLGSEEHLQTGIVARDGFWNLQIRDMVVQDFAVGMSLRDCWTARIRDCSVERSIVHCIRWENATAGEITGCRLDQISGSVVTGRGRDCVYVSFGQSPPFYETVALSVSNNSFQNAEHAGFRGIGLGNVTFTNNFFENDNRAGQHAVIMLEAGLQPLRPPGASEAPRRPRLRVVNITGGFITPGTHGRGPAVCIGDYEVINLVGLDIRGASLERGLHLFGRRSRVNVIGVHSALPNHVRSPRLTVQGSVLPLPRRRRRGRRRPQQL